MSFVPEFEDDIFISYAHVDDEALTEEQQGWISNLHKILRRRLYQLLGEEPQIWLDENEVLGNDYFDTKIREQLSKIAILVSVVSPRYLKSDWCIRELKEFYELADKLGALRVGTKSRIFKVVKTPPEQDEPNELKGLTGYNFYSYEGKRLRELDPRIFPSAKEQFFQRVEDLAQDIQKLLQVLREARKGRPIAEDQTNTKGTVYLAETTSDLADERDKIRRDLEQRQFSVVPDAPLPTNGRAFLAAVKDYMQRSSLAIHMVGENYGVIPESETQSAVVLQNQIGAQVSHDAGLRRLIWVPSDRQPQDERQIKFIKQLHEDSQAQSGAEVIDSGLEDLKTVIRDKIADGAKPAPAPNVAGSAPPGKGVSDEPVRIYIVADQQDVDTGAVAPLEDYLYDQGHQPILPIFGEDDAKIREDHEQNLRFCDACLIYFGAASEYWLRAKINEMIKNRATRSTPLAAFGIYLGAPETPVKTRFRTHEATVIRNFGSFDPGLLNVFLSALRRPAGAK
jgi:TIR domain